MTGPADQSAALSVSRGSALRELAARVQRKRRLQAMCADLARQADDLARRVAELDRRRMEEQADVDSLERTSLSRLFYQFTGKLEEKLDQETAQALAAAVEYRAAAEQLRALQEDLARWQAELAGLIDCEAELQRALEAQARAVKASGGADAGRVSLLEEEIAQAESRIREIDEALTAGEDALAGVSSIQASLSSAEGWGTWDLLGGGLFSDLAKHSHLDEAQQRLTQLQVSLRRFRAELVDVDVSADFSISIDGFLRFADYFFDGLFADWAVLDHIHDAQSQVLALETQIRQLLQELAQRREAQVRQLERRQAQREVLLLSSAP